MDPEVQAMLDAEASMAAVERYEREQQASEPAEPPPDNFEPRTAMQEGRPSDIPPGPVYVPPQLEETAKETQVSPPIYIKESRGASRDIDAPSPQSFQDQLTKAGVAQPFIPLVLGWATVALAEPTPAGEIVTAALIGAGIAATVIQKSGILPKLATAVERQAKETGKAIAASDLAIILKNPERGENLLGDPFAGATAFKEGLSLKAADIKDNINVFLLTNPVKTDILDKWPTIASFKEGIDVLTKPAADYLLKVEIAKTAVKEKVTDLINQGIVRAKDAESIREWLQGQVNQPNADVSPPEALTADTARQLINSLEYKRMVLEAARKSYVATLDPQPLKGDYSDAANAAIAAAGLKREIQTKANWLATTYSQEAYKTAYKDAVKEGVSNKEAAKQANKAAERTYAQTITQTAAKAADQASTKADTQTNTSIKEATRYLVSNLTTTQTATNEATRERDITRTNEMARTKTAKIPKLTSGGKTDEDKQLAAKFKGAVAWKQGSTVYAVKAPYKSIEDVATFSSKDPPPGLYMARGKGSAYKTIRRLRGLGPRHPVDIDLGIQDVRISKGQRPRISFRPDPFQRTTGDITIGERNSRRITPRRPRIGR